MTDINQPDEHQRLSIAFLDLVSLPQKFDEASELRSLDASHNRLTDLQLLENCTQLETLILDNNLLPSACKLPSLPNLRYLSVNNNWITNLVSFIDVVQRSCPRLRWLSMLNNEACPNYFNNCTAAEYAEYRLYVIAHFKTLKVLDNTHITDKERNRAYAEGIKTRSIRDSAGDYLPKKKLPPPDIRRSTSMYRLPKESDSRVHLKSAASFSDLDQQCSFTGTNR